MYHIWRKKVDALMGQNVSSEVKVALHHDERRYLSDELAQKYGFNDDELKTVRDLIDGIILEIMSDLQAQYDHLKELSFIEK